MYYIGCITPHIVVFLCQSFRIPVLAHSVSALITFEEKKIVKVTYCFCNIQ